MPWTVSDPPPPAKNWTEEEKKKCVAAANAVLRDGKSEEDAIYACIHAAGRSTKAVNKKEPDGEHPSSHYLVVEDSEKPSTWHLPVYGADGKPDHTRMGAAWAALHGGYRGNKYEGPGKAAAIAKLKRLYKSEGMELPSEGKSMDRKEVEQFLKGLGGPTSFEELDQLIAAEERASEINDLTWRFQFLVENIMISEDVADKAAAVESLASEFSTRLRGNENKGLLARAKDAIAGKKKEEDHGGFALVKNASGEWVWFARYSNKWRDEDNPPEIISEQSHLRFVKMANEGQVPMPELWLWHIPGTEWGKAQWVGYDKSGFALAAGVVYPGFEEVAEVLSKQSGVLLSHGMPKSSIKRDSADDSIIVEHETREISPLPSWAAANKMTSFVLLKENAMDKDVTKGISLDDREKIRKLGITDPMIDMFERENDKAAILASEQGLESKEAGAVTEDVVNVEEANEEVAAEQEQPETAGVEAGVETPAPLAQIEIEKALVNLIKAVEMLNDRFESGLAAVSKQIDEVRGEQTQLRKDVEDTPLASMSESLLSSIIGKEEARVDGRTKLANDKPNEKSGGDGRPDFFFRRFES